MDIMKRIKNGANKAQSMVEVNKIKGQIIEIEDNMNDHFLEMGKVFYEGYRAEDMSVAETEMVKLSRACDNLRGEIDGLRERIAELKNERLCQCGHVVALDVNFCPHCGTKLLENESKHRKGNSPYTEKKSRLPEDLEILDPTYHESDEEVEPVDSLDNQLQDVERVRRQFEELERERERQLELDRRIGNWNNDNDEDMIVEDEGVAPELTFNCQICAVDLQLGSKWCPRCGAEQI
ncbi:zinc ribbon domain-containing protein [Paenibacillus glacialis]|uniref:Zinc ribbon domain-containing protein n=1 Tax=Paenibacillus glacialis TaxID=494026 RepID=A0A168N5W5_9BACL|nr:zinc ribbon domain-containing protein [Paenibacillus glacialis]OAB45426.1 hypothetical protein PGLA_04015 [Paenibacillus glacialis]